jgi:hypothetical protein
MQPSTHLTVNVAGPGTHTNLILDNSLLFLIIPREEQVPIYSAIEDEAG